MDYDRERDLVVFMHIPKTAGNSMRLTMNDEYQDRFLDLWVHSPTAEDGEPVSVPREGSAAASLMSNFAGPLPPQAVAMNLPYGVHHLTQQRCLYLSFVREPVDRCVSRWYFSYKMRDERPMWRMYESLGFDIERILASEEDYCLFEDQVRSIVGDPIRHPTSENLDEAMALIENDYFFVGTSDRFDECVSVISGELGWAYQAVDRQNVGDRSDMSLLPEGALEIFGAANQLDAALYQWIDREYLPERMQRARNRVTN